MQENKNSLFGKETAFFCNILLISLCIYIDTILSVYSFSH